MMRCLIHGQTDCSPLLNGCSYLTSREGPMTDDDTEQPWWVKHSSMVTLTRYMAEQGYTADQVAYAVEKPWKHDDVWQKASRPIAAVNGGD